MRTILCLLALCACLTAQCGTWPGATTQADVPGCNNLKWTDGPGTQKNLLAELEPFFWFRTNYTWTANMHFHNLVTGEHWDKVWTDHIQVTWIDGDANHADGFIALIGGAKTEWLAEGVQIWVTLYMQIDEYVFWPLPSRYKQTIFAFQTPMMY